MGKLFWALVLGFGVFACYHYWPHATVRTGHKIVNTAEAAAKAGYQEARK